jgi:hypothetical protein
MNESIHRIKIISTDPELKLDNNNNNNNPWRYSSDEPWPAEQPPLAVFLDCTRGYWVDMWSALQFIL